MKLKVCCLLGFTILLSQAGEPSGFVFWP
ncbi:MAG: hypothetical protein JWO80_3263, partial [Bryobacterales bacterium]|nr:hypothetical protein [Bryobacterales bacterium]